MVVPSKWQYRICSCQFKVTAAGGIFRADEGYWTMIVDKEVPLAEGLKQMGEEGYELAGIQASYMRDNTSAGTSWFSPSSIYVFKRPYES